MENKPHFHRAWLVLVSTLCIYAGVTGLLINCTGVLFSAVLKDMGFRAGDLSLFYTIRSLASSLAMPFTVKLFFDKNTKVVMTVLGTLTCAGTAAMFFFDQLWQWYVAAAVVGVGFSCTMVAIPVVLNNWFHKSNGFAIGLTMAGSGIAGAVFSPILSSLILSYGWRTAALIMALVSFVLIVPTSLLLLVSSPEKVGCQPYGDSEVSQRSQTQDGPVSRPKPYIFLLALLAGITAMGIVQFANQLPTFAQTVGYTIETGAILTSCCMVGNLVGKLLYGALADRIGVYNSARIYILAVIASMMGFLFFSSVPAALYASAALFGASYSVNTMTSSLLFLDLYGQQEYRGQLSRMQAINGVISAFLSALIPYMYDLTGSFNIVFISGTAVLVISLFIYTYLRTYSKKSKQSA